MNSIPRFDIRPGFSLPRLIKGSWQLAQGHGALGRGSAVEDMLSFVEAGMNAFDCGDVYIGVEELIGQFIAARRARGARDSDVAVLTKYIPDRASLRSLTKGDVEANVDRSLRRLKVDTLDLVQFHWWDLSTPRYIEVLGWLDDIRCSGKIDNIGVVNFDGATLQQILSAGLRPATIQVQYSLLDHRAERTLVSICQAANIPLLCYGTIAGGFLSDNWLGKAEPTPPFENRSLNKYKMIIEEFGQWELFQGLLRTLRVVATRYNTDIATVAMRYVLERPQVGGLIVGARNTSHLGRHMQVFTFNLAPDDYADIESALAKGRSIPGDFYDLERDTAGPHGRIMKQNLGREFNHD